MNKRGTIRDITEWAEACMPGEESRARSAVVTIRKAGMWSYGANGPRGKSAPYMKLTDFPTALCTVLHNDPATKSDEAVKRLWALPLSLISLETADEGDAQFDPQDQRFNLSADVVGPYFDHFGFRPESLRRPRKDHLISLMTTIFSYLAPHRDFHRYDFVELQSAADNLAFSITLHGAEYYLPTGYRGEGVGACSIKLTFGDLVVHDSRGVMTTRRLGSDALNALSRMAPNLTKGEAD